MNFAYNTSEIAILAQNAISIRFQSSNPNFNSSEYTVTAVPNSIPITSYLNNVKVVSYDGTNGSLYTSSTSSNWIGTTTAKARIWNDCFGDGGADADFRTVIWSGCGNDNGLHIFPNMLNEIGYQRCTWDWIPPNDSCISINSDGTAMLIQTRTYNQ